MRTLAKIDSDLELLEPVAINALDHVHTLIESRTASAKDIRDAMRGASAAVEALLPVREEEDVHLGR